MLIKINYPANTGTCDEVIIKGLHVIQIKYDTIGRHYFVWDVSKDRWQRCTLKGLAYLTNIPAIHIASRIKADSRPHMEHYPVVNRCLFAIKYCHQAINKRMQQGLEGTTGALREQLVYYKSQLWYLCLQLGFPEKAISSKISNICRS